MGEDEAIPGARAPGGTRLPRLRALRTARFLSQDALAKKAGVARYTVRRVEQGEPARYATALKLAQALGVEPGELVEGGDSPRMAAAA